MSVLHAVLRLWYLIEDWRIQNGEIKEREIFLIFGKWIRNIFFCILRLLKVWKLCYWKNFVLRFHFRDKNK